MASLHFCLGQAGFSETQTSFDDAPPDDSREGSNHRICNFGRDVRFTIMLT